MRRSNKHGFFGAHYSALLGPYPESEQASSSLARTCSGDMYATVPIVDPGLRKMLRTHALGHSLCQGHCGPRFRKLHFRQAKVQNLRVPAIGRKNVGRFDALGLEPS